MTLQDSDIYTVEADAWDGSAVQTLRGSSAGSSGFTTASTDMPASVPYPSCIASFAMQSRTAFGDRMTAGNATIADGNVGLFNRNPGPLDSYRSYAFDARMITVRRGQRSAAYPSGWRVLMRAPMHVPSWDHDTLNLRVRDARKLTSVPLTTTKFAGTNSAGVGLEGTPDDLKGKNKPVAIGRSFNVSPALVNADQQIYQFADKAATVDGVREGGYSLGVSFPLVSRTVPATNDNWFRIAHGDGKYVAVSVSHALSLVSTDGGVTWASHATPATYQTIVYADALGLFVAGGTNAIGTSPDGVTWTARTSFSTQSIGAIAWSPKLGLLCAVTSSVGVAAASGTSADGITWTLHASISANRWTTSAMTWGKDRFVVVGQDITTGGAPALIAYSLDGVVFTQATDKIAAGNTLQGVAYDSILDRYVACWAGTTDLESSEDAITWTRRPTGGSIGWRSVCANDGLFVAVGDQNAVNTSNDGIVWTLKTAASGAIASLSDVVVVGTNVVTVGYTGSLGEAFSSAPIATYATLADLQDDTLAPAEGTYKIYSGSAGSYFRLGSPAVSTITCDPVQGTTAADRTGAQLMVQAFKRAGLGTPNLALWSEDFSNAVWNKSGATVSANATTNPFSFAFTADKIQEDNSTGGHEVNQLITCPLGTYTYSVYVHAAERTKCTVNLSDNATGQVLVIADLSAGTLSGQAASGSWSNPGSGIEYAGDNWFRVWVTGTRGAGTQCLGRVFVYTTSASYLGTTGSGIYVWGAQLDTGILVKSYTPTTSVSVVGGDWSAYDIAALDAKNSAEMGVWFGPDDASVCADIIDDAARSLGAMWFGDARGAIRARRLEAASTNIVASPSSLGTAPWSATGTASGTNAVATYAGKSFSRINNASGGGTLSQPITLTGNTQKRLAFDIHTDGHAGTYVVVLSDTTAGAGRLVVTCTIDAIGGVTATASTGILIGVRPLGSGAYRVVVHSVSTIAANTHVLNAIGAGTTASSVLVSEFDVQDAIPVTTFTESDLQDTLVPLDSGDPNEGIPPYETQIQYARNYTVQTSGIDGAVSGAERSMLGLEWRVAKATDSAVLTAHPLSQPQAIQSLYAFEADAQTEATRLQALKGTAREWYGVPTKLTDASLNVELGDVVEVVNGRFGLAGGALVIPLGLAPVLVQGGSVNTLTTWR